MHLTKHISDLLYRYDCVTVPGFGAFLGTPAPAELDTITKPFTRQRNKFRLTHNFNPTMVYWRTQ